ncbi:hypothetical protein J8273_6744 [Carpediemonas membranifera]|uniref:DNA-directed RNA polymerase RBP11-like dimerisation domain-containing protein n=1 Tax=Carpediemonas membranifera TaxID=201153 RepID=A0A8J6E2I3_9EUKA|nr:hypothetical protein J8273_6744 [Carpediemonas membranifera]|eukprot:KAG9391942.1 hypothetical protein J8273_6744 [Carpediemonas membranifera]
MTDTTNATVVFHGEDHTLGNALRYCLARDEEVDFAGYTVPHPAESRMVVRIQTNGIPAATALHRAADTLENIADDILDKFNTALNDFEEDEDAF